jgi:hypothetical protein
VAFRPLHVTELAEILSFDFKTGPIPKFHEDLRLEDPVEAVLSTTSSLLAIIDVEGSRVIQFSHFSVKEYLTSSRLAKTSDIFPGRYYISMTSAHTLAAQACLGILLHLDNNIVRRDSIKKYPLTRYAAKYWVDHARFEGVSGNVEDGMKRLFDPSKEHLANWVRIYDPLLPPYIQEKRESNELSLPGSPTEHAAMPPSSPTSQAETLPRIPIEPVDLGPCGLPLHYAAHCGLHSTVKFLIIQHSQDVDSRNSSEFAPLHLAS